MPELPEVEAARRAIEDHCIGKKIRKSIIADDPKVIDGVSSTDFEAALLGKAIVAAYRKGKNMWLQLDSPPFPSFQFGMTGAIYIKGVAVTKYKRSAVNDTDEWPSKYSKLFIELEDGLELSFTDKRRFAKVRLLGNPASVPPISDLGPDALLEPMNIDEFSNSLSKKKIGIKALLLDQSFISGIGNWIADEVLYQSRIHPLQIAASLSRQSCEALLKCIKEVIKFAVEVDADCSCFPLEWLFHFRWGKKPGKVSGKKIEFIAAGGRTTAYIPELQRLSGIQATQAVSKQRKGTVKKKKDDDGDNDDEPSSEKVEIAGSVKTHDRRKTTIRRGKKAPANKKSKGSSNSTGIDDVEDDGDQKKLNVKQLPGKSKSKETKAADKDQVKKTGVRKPAAKRKSKDSDDDHDDSDDVDDEEDQKEIAKRKQSEVEKTTMTRVQTSRSGRQLKRAK